MIEDNFLDIPETTRNRPVYRIISVERLFKLFEHKQNVLVSPRKWEDPFENFILNSAMRLPSGELAPNRFRNRFYGQCWTLNQASDAMWRIYSPKANAVRIRTTIRKLFGSLNQTCGARAREEVFIGRVKYLPNKRLIQFAENSFKDAALPAPQILARTLLVKRPAFKHEREIRLLYSPHNGGSATGGLYPYLIDPHTFIDQIMMDPRLPQSESAVLRNQITSRTQFRGSILRSLLYAAPPALIIQFGQVSNLLNGPGGDHGKSSTAE